MTRVFGILACAGLGVVAGLGIFSAAFVALCWFGKTDRMAPF